MASSDLVAAGGHPASPVAFSSGPTSLQSVGQKRKREDVANAQSAAENDPAPGSHRPTSSGDAAAAKSQRNFSKRACNECRQQKLRCDVVTEPAYQTCSRCRRLKLDCRIDANFRRVDKRNKNSQMERELAELRQRLAEQESQASPGQSHTTGQGSTADSPAAHRRQNMTALHQGAADSLLELRHSSATELAPMPMPESNNAKVLRGFMLTREHIDKLFAHYFSFWHPLMPILDPDRSPDYYYECSELLFWAIVAVAARRYEDDLTLLTGLNAPVTKLIWSTMAEIPQNYHVVKALCLLCTWPLPTKTSHKDPTFMLAGLMMQIALQTGLHRPSHVQAFSRVRIELKEEDIQDRLKTWAGCTIVSQNISTGFGQPPRAQWDFILTSDFSIAKLPQELFWLLKVERFCHKVSRLLYMKSSDPIGISGDEERPGIIHVLSEDYRELNDAVSLLDSQIPLIHLQAVGLHLKLSTFFDAPSAYHYTQDLLALYNAATIFLKTILDSPWLKAVNYYLMQMTLSAGFTIAKLLNSFFAHHVDLESGRRLFNSTINAIRAISINNNDLPARLAEVLTQLWRNYGAGIRPTPTTIDDSLQLRIRCRMSMSVVYDSVWRWREQFQFRHDGSTAQLLDTSNPTDPNPPVDPSGAPIVAATDPADPPLNPVPGPLLPSNAGWNDSFGDPNFVVFDPLMSMLDLDFGPYDPSPGDPLQLGSSNMF